MFEGPMNASGDDELMRQIAEGDPAAAEHLARHLGPPAFGYAFRLTGARADAEDIAQEAMLRLIRQAPSWQAGRAGIRAWLWRVIGNLAMDRGRRLKRSAPLDAAPVETDDSPSGEARLQQKARLDALQTALLHLPDRQRQAVVLRYIEGLSMVEAAAVMEISPTAIDSLAMRGRRALAETLGPRREELGVMP